MNPPVPHPSPPAAPQITTRQELDAVVENIVQLQLERAELEQTLERELAEVRQRYRRPLAEIDRFLLMELRWVEDWAERHPGLFGAAQSLELTHAVIGFRVTPPRVDRASRRWTWAEIAAKLGEVGWGRRYLRQAAPEVNKEALLADRAELLPAELKLVGLKIAQDRRFFLTPHREADPAYQEAA